ncbi:hypothetical protein [Actinokineospora diospyrosa]|uniref:Uncharacterized protein n=1 Tax=Actinokineospora diospyrosa TaxID=103728 RepID=A0ABT1I5P0_9PSEU|nr:hypothetical protein [Actinokineospora diospyrosa]MCP2267889.1 hypothetical protein [Actinokineospora diospyrosa]
MSRSSATLLLVVLLAFAGLVPPAATASPVPSDFSIGLNVSSVSLYRGNGYTAQISTSVTNGAAEAVSFTASGMPPDVSIVFNPSSVTVGTTANATITVGSGATAGSYPIQITGQTRSARHSVSCTLDILVPDEA